MGDWGLNDLPFEWKGNYALSKKKEAVLFGVTELRIEGISLQFSAATDVFVSWKKGKRQLLLIGVEAVEVSIGGKENEVLKSGESIDF